MTVQTKSSASRIDRSIRIINEKGYRFQPLRPDSRNEIPLKQAGLSPQTELISFEVNGERRVLILHEMVYHHTCQGELAGEPYLVTF